MPILFV